MNHQTKASTGKKERSCFLICKIKTFDVTVCFVYTETKKDMEGCTVKCSEVITVKLGCDLDSHAKGKFQYLEAITHDANVFSIWFIERYQQHRWRPRHVSFHSRDSSVAQKWVDRIKTILSRSGQWAMVQLSPLCDLLKMSV